MPKNQQDWKSELAKAFKKFKNASEKKRDPLEQKKRSRIMFQKRKLNAVVQKHVKKHNPVKSKEIEKIHDKYGKSY